MKHKRKRTTYTDEELVAAMRHVELTEGYQTQRSFCRRMGFSVTTIYRRFGGWNELRKRAELDIRHQGQGQGYTREEVLEALRRIVRQFGPDVTEFWFTKWAGISRGPIHRLFDSWANLRNALNLPRRKAKVRITDEELLEELDRLDRMLGRYPTYAELHALASASGDTYYRRFGKMHQLKASLTKYRIKKEVERRTGQSVPVDDYRMPDDPPKQPLRRSLTIPRFAELYPHPPGAIDSPDYS